MMSEFRKFGLCKENGYVVARADKQLWPAICEAQEDELR